MNEKELRPLKEPASQETLGFFAQRCGQEWIDFLREKGFQLFQERHGDRINGETVILLFELQGRVIEIMHRSKLRPDSIELAFSFSSDFTSNDKFRFEKQNTDPTDLISSTRFLKSLVEILQKMKKDTKLALVVRDVGRKKLAELLVSQSGLSNARVIILI